MQQLQNSSELFKTMDDPILILIWTEDSHIFRAGIPNGSLLRVDENVLNNAVGKRIPENHLFPPWRYTHTEAQQPPSPDVYVKKHYAALRDYDGTPYATELIMAEVKVLEVISKKAHSNVNKYLGCVRNGDAIAGLCFQKCDCALGDLV
jgi:hypothetical protein